MWLYLTLYHKYAIISSVGFQLFLDLDNRLALKGSRGCPEIIQPNCLAMIEKIVGVLFVVAFAMICIACGYESGEYLTQFFNSKDKADYTLFGACIFAAFCFATLGVIILLVTQMTVSKKS